MVATSANSSSGTTIATPNQQTLTVVGTSLGGKGSLALPLLEGLVSRRDQADAIVHDVLVRWKAGVRLSSSLAKAWRSQKSKRKDNDMQKSSKPKRRRFHSASPHSATSSTLYSHDQDEHWHWLLRSLQSPSAGERQVACRILCMGCPLDAHTLWQLVEILASLLSKLLHSEELVSSSSSSSFSSVKMRHRGSSVACIVTLIALLKHTLLLPVPHDSKGSSGSNSNNGFVLPFLIHRRIGLRWICTTLWTQAVTMADTKRIGHQSTRSRQSIISAALVDLLYHLVLVGDSQDALQQADGFLWNINGGSTKIKLQSTLPFSLPLSPLACLIATYHIWKKQKLLHGPLEKRMISVLKQLIDPHTTPHKLRSNLTTSPNSAVSPTTTDQHPAQQQDSQNETTTSSNHVDGDTPETKTKIQKRRLMDTFEVPSTTTTTAAQVGDSPTKSSKKGGTNDRDSSVPGSSSSAVPHLSLLAGNSNSAENTTSSRRRQQQSEEVSHGTSAAAAVARIFNAIYGRDDAGLAASSAERVSGEGDEEDEDHDRNADDGDMMEEDDELEEDDEDDEEDDEEDDGQAARSTEQSEQPVMEDEEEDLDIHYMDRDKDGQDQDEEHEVAFDEECSEDEEMVEAEDASDDSKTREKRKHPSGNNGAVDDEEDEEIDSEEEDCESEDHDDEDEDDGENDIVIRAHEDDIDEDEMHHIRQSLLDLQDMEDEDRAHSHPSFLGYGGSSSRNDTANNPQNQQRIAQRKEMYIRACMQVLAQQHPTISRTKNRTALSGNPIMPVPSECDLMHSMLNIVKPPKKPLNTKIILRRAPTQEEFFRGSLSKNPVSLNMLRRDAGTAGEPTMRDLRQHIATDLQMADSAELLELLVANKIVDVDLKVRVVHQVLWKNHLVQNINGASGIPSGSSVLSSLLGGGRGSSGGSLVSTGSGLSLIFNRSDLGIGASGSGRSALGDSITEETPLAALPPMIVTYRLTGVDGEATEDTVTTLDDPEAPSEATDPAELDARMEKEFGLTRLLTEGRGVLCLLKSLERSIGETLRKIRRDDVGPGENFSRQHFKKATPNSGLSLLTCCAKLASNRKLLLQSRAPTVLLRLLLDVLHALEDDGQSESNLTAKGLQELIEALASDMVSSNGSAINGATPGGEAQDDDSDQDASTLRLLLNAIETSYLSPPLRNVIAKLLPYLTYGQTSLSKELAMEFSRHVNMGQLAEVFEQDETSMDKVQVLMATFVHASINMPSNEVCNSLRMELINCGYVEQIIKFVLTDVPTGPPSWSPSLWAKNHHVSPQRKSELEQQWKFYLQRSGLKVAFDMLIGLCSKHESTQALIGNFEVSTNNEPKSFVAFCHWMEATSDFASAQVSMNGLGLLAETLLDELAEEKSPVSSKVKVLRRQTRNRKKEIAMNRRSKALLSVGAFGSLGMLGSNNASENKNKAIPSSESTILAPVLGVLQNSESSSGPPGKRRKKDSPKQKSLDDTVKPAWMTEMEDMEDETGLTCAVCQEGSTLQPSELLGLYAYVKKVSLPISQGGGQSNVDGTNLLIALPATIPESLAGTYIANEWYTTGRAAGLDLKESSPLSSLESTRRAINFSTSVSAANAIHCSCHTRARQADRSHPKAPKSEWEGASLRNSRVKCNVIIPLVSSRSSKVPLVAVDAALTEHQTAVSNLLGVRPRSMLWNSLHDVRLLLVRMAYGEPLNADCGGGSLASNCKLVFYQLLMADMFEKDAQLDSPETAQHARILSAGFLAASAILKADDFTKSDKTDLQRGVADSSVMACLTCILFHNTKGDPGTSSDQNTPHPNRRWVVGREHFLNGLLRCAGLRHALGVTSSGCITARNTSARRSRHMSFASWESLDREESMDIDSNAGASDSSKGETSRDNATIEDFRDSLRPMITIYAMMDQLSNDFVPDLDDVKIEELSNRLVQVIERCHRCKSIEELLLKAKVTLDHDEIIREFQSGMISV